MDYESGNDLSYKLFEKNDSAESAEPDAKIVMDRLETSGTIQSSPTFYKGTIIFGSNDHHLYCISASGELVWKYRTGGLVTCNPLVVNDVVYSGSFDGCLHAVSFRTGNMLWKFQTGSRVTSYPTYSNGRIYFGSEDCNFYCISPEGDLIWKFRANGEIYSAPVIVGKNVYFSCCDKRVYCVREGELVWSYLTGGVLSALIAIGRDGNEFFGRREKRQSSDDDIEDIRLFVGSFDTNYYMLSSDGRLLWKFKTGESSPITRAATAKDNVIYFGNFDKHFYALSIDGELRWKYMTGGPISTVPLLYKNNIYFGSTDGYFYALSLDGQLIWKLKTGGAMTSSPIAENDVLYFGSFDTYLYAVSIKEPKVLWRFQSGFAFQASVEKAIDAVSKVSKLQRAFQRLWKPETKQSSYEKEAIQRNFTFGPAYKMHEPYKSGVEYESGMPYTEKKKKKDWRPF